MRYGFLIIFLSISTLLRGNRISLEEAIDIAFQQSYSVQKLEKEMESLISQKQISRSNLWPTMGARSTIETQSSTQSASHSYVYINWNLFNQFEDYRETQIVDQKINLKRKQIHNNKINIKNLIKTQFHNYISSEKNIDILSEGLEEIRTAVHNFTRS